MKKDKARVQQKAHREATPSNSERGGAKKPKKHYDQLFFRAWCKRCGLCSALCPRGVIVQDETGAPQARYPDACTGCLFCELHCPDFAITIRERDESNGAKGKDA